MFESSVPLPSESTEAWIWDEEEAMVEAALPLLS
jgi:hypothetical protein